MSRSAEDAQCDASGVEDGSEDGRLAQRRENQRVLNARRRAEKKVEESLDLKQIRILTDKVHRLELEIARLKRQLEERGAEEAVSDSDEDSGSGGGDDDAASQNLGDDDYDYLSDEEEHEPQPDGYEGQQDGHSSVRPFIERMLVLRTRLMSGDEKDFSALFHCTPEEYIENIEKFFLPYVMNTTMRGTKRERAINGAGFEEATKAQLFLYILYCSQYPPLNFLANCVVDAHGWNGRRYLQKVLYRVQCALDFAYNDETLNLREHGRPSFPHGVDLDWMERQVASMKVPEIDANIVVDGMGLAIVGVSARKDAMHSKEQWSNKNHRKEVPANVFMMLNGMYLHATPVSERGEQTAFRESHWAEYAREEGQGILTDAGYTLNYATSENTKTKKQKTSDATTTTTTTASVTATASSTSAQSSAPLRHYFTPGPTAIHIAQAILRRDLPYGDEMIHLSETETMTVFEFCRHLIASAKRATAVRNVAENGIMRLRNFNILELRFRQYMKHGPYSLNIDKVLHGLMFYLNRLYLHVPSHLPRGPSWKPKLPKDSRLVNVPYGYPGNPLSGGALGRFTSNMIKKFDEAAKKGKAAAAAAAQSATSATSGTARKKRTKHTHDDDEEEASTSDDAGGKTYTMDDANKEADIDARTDQELKRIRDNYDEIDGDSGMLIDKGVIRRRKTRESLPSARRERHPKGATSALEMLDRVDGHGNRHLRR